MDYVKSACTTHPDRQGYDGHSSPNWLYSTCWLTLLNRSTLRWHPPCLHCHWYSLVFVDYSGILEYLHGSTASLHHSEVMLTSSPVWQTDSHTLTSRSLCCPTHPLETLSFALVLALVALALVALAVEEVRVTEDKTRILEEAWSMCISSILSQARLWCPPFSSLTDSLWLPVLSEAGDLCLLYCVVKKWCICALVGSAVSAPGV